ncbi:MAG: phage holin family protein [Chromatiaceae bacterium]
MEPTAAGEQGVGFRAASSDPGQRAAVPHEANLLWQALRGLAHDRLELAALETQRAGESLVAMVVAGMLVAGLLLSAWLGLLGAAIVALTNLGIMETGSALLLTVPVNLVVALILWRVIGRLSHDLRFPSNARSLEPPSSQCQETETS